MAEQRLSWLVYQGAKSKLTTPRAQGGAGLTESEAEQILASPQFQQAIIDYRNGAPLPAAVQAWKSDPKALDNLRSIAKTTGMSFGDVAVASAFAPSLPTRNPGVSHIQPFAQGGPLYQNSQLPGVARGQALARSTPTLSPEALSPYVSSMFSGTESPFFSAIRRSEGTTDAQAQAAGYASGYDLPLGYGQYGTPPKPLTEMTLKEVYDFGREVLNAPNNPHNSSAMGAFQIVGKTLKEFMGPAGLTWDDKFTPENQQKLAIEIAKGQGVDSGTWASFGLAKNRENLAIARASFESATPGYGPSINWGGISNVTGLPQGEEGFAGLTETPESLSRALGVTAPDTIDRVSATPYSPVTATSSLAPVGSQATPISANLARAISPIAATPLGFGASQLTPLGSNVAVNALGSNVGVSALGANATATPRPITTSGYLRPGAPISAVSRSPLGKAASVAPVQMPTIQMPAVPAKPASPFETLQAANPQTLSALGPQQTLGAVGPSQTLTPLGPQATLQALPPNIPLTPLAAATLRATLPGALTAAGKPASLPQSAFNGVSPNTPGIPQLQPGQAPSAFVQATRAPQAPTAFGSNGLTAAQQIGVYGPQSQFFGMTPGGTPTYGGRSSAELNQAFGLSPTPSMIQQIQARGISNAANILTANLHELMAAQERTHGDRYTAVGTLAPNRPQLASSGLGGMGGGSNRTGSLRMAQQSGALLSTQRRLAMF